MSDWGLIAIRLALYADLMLLVGLAAFPLYSLTRNEQAATNVLSYTRLLVWLAIGGIVISVIGFAAASAAMMGVPVGTLDNVMLVSMATDTNMGVAWCVRMVTLAVVLAGLVGLRRRLTALHFWTIAGSAIALSTLVWSGHAGATEGTIGVVHRISDIAHMIAGALWLGGIAAFALWLSARVTQQDEGDTALLTRALVGFASVGTASVAIIVLTGLFNSFVILGPDFTTLLQSTYGWLLMAKVALVGTMLLLAAYNRWSLTPALEQSLPTTHTQVPRSRLRRSIALEMLAGAFVLVLVALLGTLSPAPGS